MNRVGLFLIVFATGTALLAATFAWYLLSFHPANSSVAGFMGQMMGNTYAYGMTAPMPSYIWAAAALLIVLAVAGIGGVGYYLAFPEIRTVAGPSEPTHDSRGSDNPKIDWSVLLRTSKPEEKKVLEVIASHDGSYLQKFIVKESGLSRLKTHRIVSRFAERGIVTVSRSGNTNEVSLAAWLKHETPSGSSAIT